MARGKKKGKTKIELVSKVGVKKEAGFLYFVDKQGDVSAAKMVRGGKKKKKSTKKKAVKKKAVKRKAVKKKAAKRKPAKRKR